MVVLSIGIVLRVLLPRITFGVAPLECRVALKVCLVFLQILLGLGDLLLEIVGLLALESFLDHRSSSLE